MEQRDDFYIPEEIAEWIGLKKSEYLSKLITLQTPEDIGFEQFPAFDKFLSGTIEQPDKILEGSDDGQTLRTYFKTYSENSGFHQVVIGVMIQDKSSKDNVFIPIISFVSKDSELVKNFSQGVVIKGHTLS